MANLSKKDLANIKILVANNELKKALIQLIDITQDTKYYNSIILQNSRYAFINDLSIDAQTSLENINIERNRLSKAILEIVDEIEEAENKKPPSRLNIRKFLLPAIIILSVLASLMIYESYVNLEEDDIHKVYKIRSFKDEVNLESWTPFTDNREKTSKFIRTFDLQIEKIHFSSNLDYFDYTGTTGPPADIVFESGNASAELILPSPRPPRNISKITAPADFFKFGQLTNLKYKITYWNNLKLDDPSSNLHDISKRFRYEVDKYQLKIIFPPNKTYKTVEVSQTHDNKAQKHTESNYENRLIPTFEWEGKIKANTNLSIYIELLDDENQ